MQKELKLEIADFIFSVIFEDKIPRLELDESYNYFLSNGKADVSIYAHYGYIPETELKKRIFNSGSTWGFYRNNGKYILEAFSKTLILEPDFKSGNIYIRERKGKQKVEYPLNYPIDELLVINLLAQKRGALIHSCGVSSKGAGLLFVGTSGAGKSTMANLWKREKGAALLSDDRIIVRKMNGRLWIYGTPWHGDAKVCLPEKAPLEKIFFLKHAKKNIVKKIEPLDAASRLIVCSFPTFWDKKGMEFTLNFCSELAQNIPCYELGFLPDESVLDFIKEKI